jgi:hypothetical protein
VLNGTTSVILAVHRFWQQGMGPELLLCTTKNTWHQTASVSIEFPSGGEEEGWSRKYLGGVFWFLTGRSSGSNMDVLTPTCLSPKIPYLKIEAESEHSSPADSGAKFLNLHRSRLRALTVPSKHKRNILGIVSHRFSLYI